jgi:anti-sigma B factor antagonist
MTMQIEHDDLDGGVRLIRLKGRLDLEGSEAVDLKLTSLAAVRKGYVIVDMNGVEFMSSIGVSVIVRVARACSSREGRLVLLRPQPNVHDVLTRTSIDQIIPIFLELEAARAAVLAAG